MMKLALNNLFKQKNDVMQYIKPIVTRLCYGESGYSTLFFA